MNGAIVFICGLLFGNFGGFFLMALLLAASREDDAMERMRGGQANGKNEQEADD